MARIHLDSQAFKHNIQTLGKIVPAGQMAIVLKDNAYGHGLMEIAQLAAAEGITHAVVRRMDEAAQIAGHFESVLVLAELPAQTPPEHIHLTLNSLEAIARTPEGSSVHLKVDSGMHRNGIVPQELESALKKIKARGLVLKGLFSHSRSGDELSSELFWQYKNFVALKAECERFCDALGLDRPMFHFANSASLMRFGKKVAFDRVRIGIAAYGYSEFDPLFAMPELKPVLSLWGERIASRRLVKGQRVGYGGTGIAERDGVVSTYDAGYADGLFRYDGRGGFALGGGSEVMGKISMDNLSLSGDAERVCLIDDARLWAKHFGTITYDVLVKLSPSIKREIL